MTRLLPVGMLGYESEELVRNPTAIVCLIPGPTVPYLWGDVEKLSCQRAVSLYEREIALTKFDPPPPSTKSSASLDEIAIPISHPD